MTASAAEPQTGRVHPLIATLAEARRLSGRRQADVAQAAGLSRRAVSYLETGRRSGLLDTVDRYASGVGYRLVLLPVRNGDGRAGVSRLPGLAHPLVRQLAADRREQGLTLSGIAVLAGTDRTQVHRWEIGFSSPGLDHFTAWAAGLGRAVGLCEHSGRQERATRAKARSL